MTSMSSENTKRILLAADEESICHPELLGLEDMTLENCSWLEALSSAEEVRAYVRQASGLQEVWISSSDEVSSLNLAAAIHQDDPALPIRLIMFSPTGSFLSNAMAVGACEVLTETSFPKRFAEASSPSYQVSEIGPELSLTKHMPQTGDPRGIILPVVSGSGGAGKSAVSAILAQLIGDRGASVVVLDLDLQFGDMHKLLGHRAPISINDVLSDQAALESITAAKDGSGGVCSPALIAAPKRLEHADLAYGHIGEVLDLCAALYDVVVVNTGSYWGEHQALLLEKSTSPIFLIDQTSSSVFACKHALELCTRLGIATSSFVFALNRCDRDALFTGIDIAMALQGAHVVELKDGGHEVEELLSAGMVEELCATKNEMLKSVQSLLDEVASMNPRIPTKKAPQASVSHAGRTLLGRRRKTREDAKGSLMDVSIEAIQAGLNATPALAVGR